jgi:hypothetical protein
VKFILRVAPTYTFVADKASKSRASDGVAKRFEFFARTFGDEFDAAVGQIAHNAGDLKTGGESLGGVAKADALDAAGIENLQAMAAGGWCERWRLFRHGRMKPNSAARRNVFCRAKTFFIFGRILFDRFEFLP